MRIYIILLGIKIMHNFIFFLISIIFMKENTEASRRPSPRITRRSMSPVDYMNSETFRKRKSN